VLRTIAHGARSEVTNSSYKSGDRTVMVGWYLIFRGCVTNSFYKIGDHTNKIGDRTEMVCWYLMFLVPTDFVSLS
jgi:hypothetical protein